MQFHDWTEVWIERDASGLVSQIRHLQVPAVGEPGRSEREVALEYLQYVVLRAFPEKQRYLPVADADFKQLVEAKDAKDQQPSPKLRFRWLPVRKQRGNGCGEAAIVILQQTVPVANTAVDLWGSGIRLALIYHHSRNAFAVTSCNSTAREPAEFADEVRKIADADLPVTPEAQRALLREALALKKYAGPEDVLRDAVTRLVAHFPGDVIAVPARTSTPAKDRRRGLLRLAIIAEVPSKAVHEDLRPGRGTDYRVVLDVATREIIQRTPTISACAGRAFVLDPVSWSGNTAIGPASCSDVLDPYRRRVMLDDLGKTRDGKCELAGPRVQIETPNRLGIHPPVTPPLDFKSRTNDFAAVSAYYHSDAMFRMVADFGFDLDDYFRDIQRPVTVVHRSSMEPGASIYDGRAINAHVLDFAQGVDGDGNPKPKKVEMRFALADLSDVQNPLGLASDVRWIWHEFCHVLVLAGTGEREFRFAHSAGDALAAIMCDPDSDFTGNKDNKGLRGVTFPFVGTPHRRHDRDVRLGWGWLGTLYDPPNPPSQPKWDIRDPAGYVAEQILSTTLFRLYRAAGGDTVGSNEAASHQRWAAAHYVTYLIVRAIGSLGPIETTPADASMFATALMEADVGTRLFDYARTQRRGGTLHKVIRWAFEKQGLYRPPSSTPQDARGHPEPVDIYLEDAACRHGEYQHTGDTGWHAAQNAVWVRQAADGASEHQDPQIRQPNFIYVALLNRGTSDATDATVEVLTRSGADAGTWDPAPGAWSLLGSPSSKVVPAGGKVSVRFGPFEWTPHTAGRHAILVRAKASGDPSNVDVGSPLPCATAQTPIADLVPFDNNLGYREWQLR
jgi:hypothetical protein